MSTHTITGYLYHVQYDWQQPHDEFHVVFTETKDMGKADPDWTLIRAHEFAVTVPDDFDARPAKIAALEEKKQEVRAQMVAKITELQEQINKLQAIEYAA